ncbi:uncharacterized protein cubi_03590 [Cryptosporidium ubiquitum]|uniref:Uncharacterized protein n=1 Tax=Cryptosporidium ubiquitum TaxID=857276 RepID=A0A1J4MHV5_9CRYT|nr:uncharacterized protein cubi_03590 [Cryptosporidium ubiquitum]OII73792.1 hypothetical protein cubi_03590 [Cryptosporidium ubiquitum]
MEMARRNLRIINYLYFLLISPYFLRFAIGESSYLNDAEKIKSKIPGFIEPITKNNIEIDQGYLEKVSQKEDRVETVQNNVGRADYIRVPRPKLISINLEDFDLPKAGVEDQIDLRLEEIKEKISQMKDLVLEYNHGENDKESTPLLGFPTKFDYTGISAEKDISQPSYIDPKLKIWMDNLDLPDETKLQVNNPLLHNTILKDPTESKFLRDKQRSQPNWKGSAKHLIEKGPVKEGLFNKLDEEGRSIPAEFENATKESELEKPDMNFSNEKTNSIRVEPEELSIQENELNSKLILTNEIPSGIIMSEKNFSYEGEQHSNNKKKNSVLLTTPEQIEYLNFEDLDEDGARELREENKTKKTRSKKKKGKKNIKKKTKNRKVVEKQDFSPPELDFIPLKLESSLNIGSEKKFKERKKNSSKKYAKEYPQHGYDDLQFEISENTPFISTLPSIESAGRISNIPMKKSTEKDTSSSFQSKKKPLKKKEPKGYSELLDIEENSANSKYNDIQIIEEIPILQLAQQKMPKRNNKKPTYNLNSQNLSNGSLLEKLEDNSEPKLSHTKKNLHNAPSKTLSNEISIPSKHEILDECNSEIFENCSIANSEETTNPKIRDLLHIPQIDENTEKINIPKSNLPKRKNK